MLNKIRQNKVQHIKIDIAIYKYIERVVKQCNQLRCEEQQVIDHRIKTVRLDFCSFRSLKLLCSSIYPSCHRFKSGCLGQCFTLGCLVYLSGRDYLMVAPHH